MKYNVVKVGFKSPLPCIGSMAWMATIHPGGYTDCELDTDTGILSLSGAGRVTKRIHVSNTTEMEFGATRPAALRKD